MKNLSIFEPQIEKHYTYKKICTLPSLIVGGGSITEFSIFFLPTSIYEHPPPPQFTEILEISTPTHLLPTPQIN